MNQRGYQLVLKNGHISFLLGLPQKACLKIYLCLSFLLFLHISLQSFLLIEFTHTYLHTQIVKGEGK